MISFLNFINVYILLACVFTLFWFYNRLKHSYWKKLNVKQLKPIPFFGNVYKCILQMNSFHQTYDQIYKELDGEPFAGIYQFYKAQLMIRDPNLLNNILVKDFKHFQDHSSIIFNPDKKINPLNTHLFFMKSERWTVVRQKLTSVFSISKLKMMYNQIEEFVYKLDEYIEIRMVNNSAKISSKDMFNKLTLTVIGSCAFGIECNSLKSDEELELMARVAYKPRFVNGLQYILSNIDSRLPNLLKLEDMRRDVSNFFVNLALDMVKYRRRTGTTRNDLLQQLMGLQNTYTDSRLNVPQCDEKLLSKNEEFDEIDIAANSFFFFIAGYESTAITLSYCFYELALNPNIQQKLRSEMQHLKNKYKEINYESLQEMTYCEAVIKETLRKYPPIPLTNRLTTADYTIPGTDICLPAGVNVVIPIWSFHHDPLYYPDPETFDPERFYGDNAHINRDGFYLPFGNGPRMCLGKHFAYMEMKTAIADLLLKYDCEPCAKTNIPLKYSSGSIFLQSECGVWVKMTRR